MAMSTQSSGSPFVSPNVTPMIDVLLVLLILFLVIMPEKPLGLSAMVPQPPPPGAASVERPTDVFLSVESDGSLLLNQDRVAVSDLSERLGQVLRARGDGLTLFIRGANDLEFQRVAQVIDVAKGVGLQRLALMDHD